MMAGHVAKKEECLSDFEILTGKIPLGRTRRR